MVLHPVFGPGEDRNADREPGAQVYTVALHPVFGPGEDRNAVQHGDPDATLGLHPVFGPGEDRNSVFRPLVAYALIRLHPVFGPGEDRNFREVYGLALRIVAAPGLRTG